MPATIASANNNIMSGEKVRKRARVRAAPLARDQRAMCQKLGIAAPRVHIAIAHTLAAIIREVGTQ